MTTTILALDRAQGFGLDEVIAADTALSDVDGAAGRLVLAGYELPALTSHFGFEGTAALFLEGAHQPKISRPLMRDRLGRARIAAYAEIDRLLAATRGLDVIEGLRASLAALAIDEEDAAIRLVGAAPVLVASLIRQAQGLGPVAPDGTAGQAEDYLRMIRGRAASPVEIAAMDAYFVTIVDHGLNASTFAARVVASTASDTVSAVVAALGALKGPLHGGAPGPVLDMLDAIDASGDATSWIGNAISGGDRLMGFGHRIYRVRDPRADILKAVVKTLGTAGRIGLAEQVEQTALTLLAKHKPDRKLETNVEFYTALLLEALAIPRQAFTPTFAVGRIVGWCAHILEQRRTGRLIRPKSHYVGPIAA
jgi:citrate synthase